MQQYLRIMQPHFEVMQLGIVGLYLEIGSCGRILGSNWDCTATFRGLHPHFRDCMCTHILGIMQLGIMQPHLWIIQLYLSTI